MVTDPPYGVNYDPAWRNQAGRSINGTTQRIAAGTVIKPKGRALADYRKPGRQGLDYQRWQPRSTSATLRCIRSTPPRRPRRSLIRLARHESKKTWSVILPFRLSWFAVIVVN